MRIPPALLALTPPPQTEVSTSAASSATAATKDVFEMRSAVQGPPVLLDPLAHNFNFRLSNLQPGDRVQFENGREFQLGRFIGSGLVSAVYEIEGEPDKLLKIPKSSGLFDRASYASFLNGFIEGRAVLEHVGVPAAKIHESLVNQYVVVERLKRADLTIERMLQDSALDPKLREDMRSSLVEFARKTAAMGDIADFKLEQMCYDPERKSWVLFDWNGSRHHMYGFRVRPDNTPEAPFWHSVFSANSSFYEYAYVDFKTKRYAPVKPEYAHVAELAQLLDDVVQEERQKLMQNPAALKALYLHPSWQAWQQQK